MATSQLVELSDGNPDGTRLGRNAADLISFHGATPTDQAAFVASALTTGRATGLIGFATSDQFDAAISLLNALQAMAVEKGLMAAS